MYAHDYCIPGHSCPHTERPMPMTNRSGFSVSKILALSLLLCGLLFWTGCSRHSGTDNIFQTAIRFEDGVICPGDCDFAAPIDEVLKAKGLTEDAIDGAQEDGRRIIQTISIDGLSEEITEISSFYHDRLVSVVYNIPVSPEEYDETCTLLQQQAESSIPQEMMLTTGSLLDGNSMIWQDEKENAIRIEIADVYNSNDKVIGIGVYVARTEEAMAQFTDG